MRRLQVLLIAAGLILAPVPAAAQAELFLRAGASFGNVSNSGVLPGSLTHCTGFAAGLGVATLGTLIGFGGEVLYAQRGLSGDTASGPDERRLDYLDIPVYLRVMLPTGRLRPYGFAGPQVSVELRCRAGGVPCPDSTAGGVRKKTDVAGVVGAGLRFGEDRAFSLEGRYVYGLSDLKLSTITSSSSYKTRSFLILAGWSF